MGQFLSQSLSQHMRLEQRLTPQLIQSMTVLQKPIAELEAFIDDALKSNAALEVAEAPPTPETDGAAVPEQRPAADDDRQFARLDRFARAYEIDGGERPPSFHRKAASGDHDPKLGALANTAARDIGLQEYLLEQWILVEASPEVRLAGEVIINHLDADGYLRVHLDRLAAEQRPPLAAPIIEEALREVQKLEPPGVGGRDVIECLLLQIDRLPGDNSVERTLISRHLNDLAHNRLPIVARETGYSIGEIQEAMRVMRHSLNLHPGHLVGPRAEPPIRPDVIVEYAREGDGLIVRLPRGNVPELRIREEVAELARGRNGKETREFARKHVEAATTIIDALHFRQMRLLQVSRAIVEKQRDFFDLGPTGLRVFRMSELAESLHCDPSTISRTVADKYMQTPRGIFPLRYFFTGGTESQDGESVGWDRVKARVREIVEGEDRKNPLTDDQIAALLGSEGLEISRRTVAKYRQQLDIPSARQRKVF